MRGKRQRQEGDAGFDRAKLRDLKDQSGLTWRQVAESADVSTGYINDLANGIIGDPAVSFVMRIAAVFDVSPLALLTYADDEVWRAGWNEGVLHAIRTLQVARSEGPG